MVINTFKEKNKEKNADKIFLKIKKIFKFMKKKFYTLHNMAAPNYNNFSKQKF